MSRFSRWSRLKTESRSRRGAALPPIVEPDAAATDVTEIPPGSEEAAPAIVPTGEVSRDADASPSDDDVEQRDEAYPEDLPPIETLEKDSDYSVFMSSKVSDAIRNRALRKLWLTDPVLANLDGLVDYGEDFTDAATVVANMKSVYKVGRGMVDYEEEDRKKAEALANAEEADPDASQQDDASDEADEDEAEGAADGVADAGTPDAGESPEKT